MSRKKIKVIGDIMLDKWCHGKYIKKSTTILCGNKSTAVSLSIYKQASNMA